MIKYMIKYIIIIILLLLLIFLNKIQKERFITGNEAVLNLTTAYTTGVSNFRNVNSEDINTKNINSEDINTKNINISGNLQLDNNNNEHLWLLTIDKVIKKCPIPCDKNSEWSDIANPIYGTNNLVDPLNSITVGKDYIYGLGEQNLYKCKKPCDNGEWENISQDSQYPDIAEGGTKDFIVADNYV